MNKNRYQYIDIAKGIVIIMMVCGHSSLPWYPQHWIFSFHMPFFFLISGFLTDWKKQSWNEYCIKKTKSLIIPFIIYSIIILLLTPLYKEQSFLEHTKEVLYNGWGGIALWFIPVLYISLLLCKVIMSFKHIIYVYICFFFLYFVTIIFKGNVELPWTLYSIPFASTFILIGGLGKTFYFKTFNYPIVIIICAIISFMIPFWNSIDMAYNKYDNIILAYTGAISSTIFILSISELLEKKSIIATKYLIFIGKNTFVILSFSQIIIEGINYRFPFLANTIIFKCSKYLILIILLTLIILFKNKVVGLCQIKKNNETKNFLNSYSTKR